MIREGVRQWAEELGPRRRSVAVPLGGKAKRGYEGRVATGNDTQKSF